VVIKPGRATSGRDTIKICAIPIPVQKLQQPTKAEVGFKLAPPKTYTNEGYRQNFNQITSNLHMTNEDTTRILDECEGDLRSAYERVKNMMGASKVLKNTEARK
jgi:hypothetical protein